MVQHKKPLIKIIKDQGPRAQASSLYFDLEFDHKVVFTKYGPQEVYVDEELNAFDSEFYTHSE
jgi:hypothetical protein